METILPFSEALALVLHHARTLTPRPTPERLPLLETLHRTLATPILAPRDQPPFDRSTRDGYALRAPASGNPDSGTRRIIGSIRAGQPWQGPALQPGEAAEIMTGAPIPPGAAAVVMIEHTTTSGNTLTLHRPIAPGANIVPRAAEARAGDTLLPANRRIAPAEIALAASAGRTHLEVHPQPRVAILATGDELVELDQTPEIHQIYNSNTQSLAALVTAESATPLRLPIARDTRDDLLARLTQAATADLILLSGGVSAGKYDLVEPVLKDLGAEFFFTGALIQPGKPIVFGSLPSGPYFFGLPGNPISTQVCFHLFVAPLLRALTGRHDIAPHFTEARVSFPDPATPIPTPSPVTRFLPAHLTSTIDAVLVTPTPWQGSGDLNANARANAYIVIPPNTTLAPNDPVRVLLR